MPPSRPSSPSSLPSSSPCSYSPYCASCGSSRNGLSSSLLRTTAAKSSEDICSIRTASCRRGESVWDWRMSALRCMEPISSPWCNDTKTQAPCRHAGKGQRGDVEDADRKVQGGRKGVGLAYVRPEVHGTHFISLVQ